MAPQTPTKTPDQIRTEQAAREVRDHSDNIEARQGADEDAIIERGQTDPLNQNAAGDPVDTGITRRETIQRSPQDDMRAQIAKRFRRVESDGERPFDGDMSNTENLYGRAAETAPADEDDSDDDLADLGLSADEIARVRGKSAATVEEGDEDESLIEPQARQPRQQADQQPAKHKIKVNGRTIEMTDEEVLAAASKTTAADAYLAEAKALLREAKAIRTGRTTNHSGENGADTDGLGMDPPELDAAQDQEPSTRSVVEKIQFGDPDEAAAELDRLVDSRAAKKATEGQLDRVYRQDFARSQKVLKEFADANPALANNRVAALAIEQGMYDGYVEDMVALGLDETQIPKGDPNQLANWHRFYRINGYDVRPTKDLLDASKKKFYQSIGELTGRRQNANPPPRQQQSRVQVSVDRDQRRAAIPNQPTRSVAPRRDADPTRRPQTGSDVVANMRRARGQPVV